MVPQVTETLGSRFSPQQITDALRIANYDVDKTVVSLLENAKTSSAARGNLPLQITIPRLETVALALSTDSKPAAKASADVIIGDVDDDAQLATTKPQREKRPTESVPTVAPAQTQFSAAEKKAFERAERQAQETCLKLSADEASASGKTKISMVVIGHVDAGKSTITGHLLYRLGYVSQKLMHKYEKESREAGKASFAYAWVMDADNDEVRVQ